MNSITRPLTVLCSDCIRPFSHEPFYREQGFIACSEECYDLAREHDFQNAFVLRMMEKEWV